MQVRTTAGRAGRGALLALLALVVVAGPVAAVAWTGEVKLSSTATADQEIVRTGATSALMVWRRGTSLLGRRTTDGGQTWLPVQTLATSVGLGTSVAAVGNRVDIVYARASTCASSGNPSRIYYRRSTDGGVTWTSQVALTSTCSETYQPDVAHSADGQVSVAWVGINTGRIFVRTSRNHGSTFGAPVHAATTENRGGDTGAGDPIFMADPELAIGSGGVTYLGYTSGIDRISLRRSTNRGTTWSAPRVLTTVAGSPNVSLVATDVRAIIGYRVSSPEPGRAVYRTTSDRGATWSTARGVIGLEPGEFSGDPEFAYNDGRLGVVVKAGAPGESPIWYRQSANFGATWSSATRVSVAHVAVPDPDAAGLAILGTVVLAGYAENGDTTGLWARRGTP